VTKHAAAFGHAVDPKKIAISAFLLFHLIAITCWSLPIQSPLITAWKNTFRPYFVWSGLFQSWDMFAPTPKLTKGYVEALIIHKNGQVKTWKFPRMEQLSLFDRYWQERYRKYVEILRESNNGVLWPDAARHVAWLNRDGANPPEIVILVRHWSDIPAQLNAPRPGEHVQIFYEYRVQAGDLQ
jgi:hypothetical protein